MTTGGPTLADVIDLLELRLALGRCFGMPHGIYPDVCDRVRGLDPPLGDELTTQPGYYMFFAAVA